MGQTVLFKFGQISRRLIKISDIASLKVHGKVSKNHLRAMTIGCLVPELMHLKVLKDADSSVLQFFDI